MKACLGSKNRELADVSDSPNENWEGKGMMVEEVCSPPHSRRKHYKGALGGSPSGRGKG